MFGLGVYRPRLFESPLLILGPQPPRRQDNPVAVYGKEDGRRLWTRADGSELRVANLEEARTAMGIDWMTWEEIREAIPPAYTEFIGAQLLASLPERGTE
jgi:DNA (cytosine-5)-methyltransferase 1